MAGPRRTSPPRDPAAERERRERARRERLRQGAAGARRSEPAPAAVAVRERHEGLVGVLVRWLVSIPHVLGSVPGAVAAVPAGAGRVLQGFAREVVAVVVGVLRPLASVVPGGRRTGRIPFVRGVGGSRSAVPSVDRGARRAEPEIDAAARRSRTAGELRAAAVRRRRLRARLRLLAVVALAVAVVAAWIVVPASDLFRIRHLEVSGTSAVADLDVRGRIDSLLDGETVFTVDEEQLARRVEQLPFVRDVRVERHLPGGLQLHVTEYRPLALGYASNAEGGAGDYWLVALDGRILAEANRDEWTGRIPTVQLREERIRPGDRVGDEASLQLLSARAPDSSVAFDVVRSDRFAISARLVDGIEVRFGRPVQLLLKVAALERALQIAERNEIELRYVDVSVPGKPAICPMSDVRCSQQRTPDEDAGDEFGGSSATTPEETGGDEPSDADAVG